MLLFLGIVISCADNQETADVAGPIKDTVVVEESGTPAHAPAKTRLKRYSTAHGMLNLRSTPSTKGEVLEKIPYGSIVHQLDVASEETQLGGMSGHWVKVDFEDIIGYGFSAYFSAYAPSKNKDLVGYVKALKEASSDINDLTIKCYEGVVEDEAPSKCNPDNIQWSTVEFKTQLSVQETYMLFRNALQIPSAISIPSAKGKKQLSVANPHKLDHVWEDGVSFTWGDRGSLSSADYFLRTEGGGLSSSIKFKDGYTVVKRYFIQD